MSVWPWKQIGPSIGGTCRRDDRRSCRTRPSAAEEFADGRWSFPVDALDRALARNIDDGRLENENDSAERALRAVAQSGTWLHFLGGTRNPAPVSILRMLLIL